jgi:anti-sigma B factor antagonist
MLRDRFRADVAIHGRVGVVEVFGEIDVDTAPKVRARVDDVLAGGCDRIVLDLAGTTFMDSTGISLLVRLTRQLGMENVVVRSPPFRVREVLAITSLDAVLQVTGP